MNKLREKYQQYKRRCQFKRTCHTNVTEYHLLYVHRLYMGRASPIKVDEQQYLDRYPSLTSIKYQPFYQQPIYSSEHYLSLGLFYGSLIATFVVALILIF
jgi:hypothetical protein